MKRIAMALVPMTIFLVGCGSTDAEYEQPEPIVERQTDPNTYVETQEAYGSVEKIVLDGVTCYVYDGSSSGGITCDWAHMNDDGSGQ